MESQSQIYTITVRSTHNHEFTSNDSQYNITKSPFTITDLHIFLKNKKYSPKLLWRGGGEGGGGQWWNRAKWTWAGGGTCPNT